jgi:hypothetical protein
MENYLGIYQSSDVPDRDNPQRVKPRKIIKPKLLSCFVESTTALRLSRVCVAVHFHHLKPE